MTLAAAISRIVRPAGALATAARWSAMDGSFTLPDGSSSPYSHAGDRRLAQAWLNQAVSLTSATREAQLHRVPIQQQVTAVRDAWQALANVYLALNIPPSADPMVDAINAAWGGPVSTLCGYRRRGVDKPVAVTPLGTGTLPLYSIPGYFAAIGNTLPIQRAPMQIGEHGTVARSWFVMDAKANILTGGPTGTEDHCGQVAVQFDPTKDPTQPISFRQCDEYPNSWTRIAWNEPSQFMAPGLGASGNNTPSGIVRWVVFTPPLYYSFLHARDIVQSIVARGLDEVVRQSILNAVRKNLIEANCWGLLDDTNDPTGQLRDASARAANSPQLYVRDSDEYKATVATFAAVGALAAAAGPEAAAVAAIYGIVLAAEGFLPAAEGMWLDGYGRKEPVFEKQYISTNSGGLPTHSVPAPDGYTPVGDPVTTLGLSPTTGNSLDLSTYASKRVQNGEVVTKGTGVLNTLSQSIHNNPGAWAVLGGATAVSVAAIGIALARKR